MELEHSLILSKSKSFLFSQTVYHLQKYGMAEDSTNQIPLPPSRHCTSMSFFPLTINTDNITKKNDNTKYIFND